MLKHTDAVSPYDTLIASACAFVDAHAVREWGVGRYRYSMATRRPTLYSSCYAALIRHLVGDLDEASGAARTDWAAYLAAHQDDDGLFRDPVIFDLGWYKDDPLWCGRSHLSCHVVAALTCLGAVAPKPLTWLDSWRDPNALVRWLESRDWGEKVAFTGNEIMNVGTLLQYARDFQNDSRAGHGVTVLLEWLATHHVNPETGLWGDLDVRDPVQRSSAIQAAYHWWPLFFYDRRPIPFVESAVVSVLTTQNPAGGFGWGVHNAPDPYRSSACEDMDSIDPLCRMALRTRRRLAEVREALTRAADWVMVNRMPDGGFVFMLNRPFEYGHPELLGRAGQGAMFPTWFRLLSLALIGKTVPGHPLGRIAWQFVRCPGMQFWEVECAPR